MFDYYSILYLVFIRRKIIETNIIINRITYKVLRNALPEKLSCYKHRIYANTVLENAIKNHAILRQLVNYKDDQLCACAYACIDIQ